LGGFLGGFTPFLGICPGVSPLLYISILLWSITVGSGRQGIMWYCDSLQRRTNCEL